MDKIDDGDEIISNDSNHLIFLKDESSDSDGLRNIRVDPPRVLAPTLAVIFIIVMPLTCLVAIPISLLLSQLNFLTGASVWQGMFFGLMPSIITSTYQKMTMKRAFKKVEGIYLANENRELDVIVTRLAFDANPFLVPPLIILPKVMAKHHCVGETVVAWFKQFIVATPARNHFEPRLLDEADEAFDDLDPISITELHKAREVTSSRPTESLLPRRLRRNLGGRYAWIPFILLALSLLGTGIASYLQGRISMFFVLLLAVFAFICLVPTPSTSLRRGQWLLVPGGVLHRRAGLRNRNTLLHVFDRRRSVLIATEMRGGQFYVSVADAEQAEKTTVTKRELQALLRAWMSPLTPPRPEELSDFV